MEQQLQLMEEKVTHFKMARKKSPKTERRILDDIWKKKVKERDKFMCQVCKKKVEGKNCHAHHIIPKTIKGFRWDTDNGITLCYQHHKVGRCSPHMNALWFTFWLKSNKIHQFNYCIEKLKKLYNEHKIS